MCPAFTAAIGALSGARWRGGDYLEKWRGQGEIIREGREEKGREAEWEADGRRRMRWHWHGRTAMGTRGLARGGRRKAKTHRRRKTFGRARGREERGRGRRGIKVGLTPAKAAYE